MDSIEYSILELLIASSIDLDEEDVFDELSVIEPVISPVDFEDFWDNSL